MNNNSIAKSHISAWEASKATKLSDVYGRYSRAKEASFDAIRQEVIDNGGYGLRIISANTFQYSCGYVYPTKENGELRFVYHTASYRRECDY